ncbi:response regulator [Methylobacterium radiotolerans]|uniref:response regulator n=1 Tax=Methylobacterium radiotolerans TaxID=31998 RepID=UPI000D5CBE48|nr:MULTISPECIES: response regulator [Methylobacterium]MDE3747327.1 response regulator [Methylobacterium radiotolerans]PVY96945.1 Hpt domain-containing protein [Methylobacterium organophilum]
MTDRILLVEDDPGSRDLIGALLAARGDAFDCAADGFLGLRLLSERRHAVVLIDYHLPEMDGYALARLMREIVGAQGRVRLVGITADRHGLASRRGADALFDAILVKPVEPDLLYATLDRLRAPDAAPDAASDGPAGVAPDPSPRPADEAPAEALWRRRGLPGRPRAALYPDLGAEAAAAVGHAFRLAPVAEADLILIGAAEGLAQSRALPPGSPGHLLPTVDLTGRLGHACDATFRVDDPTAWTALAQTCRAFAERRAGLAAAVRDSDDPACRLLSWLHVGARSLPLSAAEAPAPILAAGLVRSAAMAAILALTEQELAACVPAGGGLAVSLTPAGLSAAVAGLAAAPAARPAPDPEPVRDAARVERLRDAIGAAEVARLTGDLRARLEAAFPPGTPRPTIAQEAHALIAMAGSLGYTRLAAACRTLEAAVTGGSDEADALGHVRGAIRDVLAERPAA